MNNTTGLQEHPKSQKPPSVRRERRAEVERLMVEGYSVAAICTAIGQRFEACPRTVRADCAVVYRLWSAQDRASSSRLRARAVRRLIALGRGAEAAGDHATAVRAETEAARLLGLLPQPAATVQVGVAIGAGTLRELVEAASREETIKPALVVPQAAIPAPGKPETSNGL